MRNLKIVFAISSFVVIAGFCKAQPKQSTVLDGIYIKEHVPARKVIPYTHLREADVMWLKRIWRRVALRAKINHTLTFPVYPINNRQSLFDVIKNSMINEGTITAYSTGPIGSDDEFTQQLTVDEVKGMLFKMDTVYTENPETGDQEATVVPNEVKTDKIKVYELKEEWFFDKQKSVMEVRIIGIAPMKEKMNDQGEVVGYERLFWIYFPEARFVFSNAEVFNRFNDSERRTFEDIFWKRQFGSYITTESNVYDRAISVYKLNLDALLEAEKIKEDIFNMEHDVWNF